MKEGITAILMLIGGMCMFLAALGMIRMPDLFTRMHMATQAATLGVGSVLAAVVVYFGHLGVTTQAVLIVAFSFLTTPVAAHMIGHASYFVGNEPLWEGTIRDEVHGHTEGIRSTATPSAYPREISGIAQVD